MQNDQAHTLLAMIQQESALAAQEQTPDVLRQRNGLLREIQEVLKKFREATSY